MYKLKMCRYSESKHNKITSKVYANLGTGILPYLVFVNVIGGFHQEDRIFAVAVKVEQVVQFSSFG